MVAEELIELDSVGSTNTWTKQLLAEADDPRVRHGLAVTAVCQNAGRGQRGNSWEAEPGMNLTMSALLSPSGIKPAGQFAISEAVAVATAEAAELLLGQEYAVRVKWPNDIYVGDSKLAGILIENIISGTAVEWSVCGIGLNVNQTRFVSDAPNPVSMAALSGRTFDLAVVRRTLMDRLLGLADRYLTSPDSDTAPLHALYLSRLWRAEGYHPYYDALRGEHISAAIESIAPTGHLTLRLDDSTLRTYAFKEVAAII